MPSGADLEYARLLSKAGKTSSSGLDGARLFQLEDEVDNLSGYAKSTRRKRDRPGSAALGRPGAAPAPVVMAAPPAVTIKAASAIAGNVITRFTPPSLGSSKAGPGLILGAAPFIYYSNRGTGAGQNNTTLSASSSAGSNTLTVPVSISNGTYSLQPSTATVQSNLGLVSSYIESRENVTVTGVSGSGPYTVQLSGPTKYFHALGDVLVTTSAPAPGYNTGSAIIPLTRAGSPQMSYEIITDAPTVEFYGYCATGRRYRIWVDGQVATSAYQSLTTGGAGEPANNASGFISIPLGSRQWRRIKLETGNGAAFEIIGVSVGPTDTVICPPEPDIRAMFIGDSYLGGFDGIADQVGRLLGWDNVLLEQIGGTGYEADNTANLGGNPGRLGYRLPVIIANRPDVVVIPLGLNDAVSSTLAATISSNLSTLKSALPNTKFYLVGPWTNGTGNASAGQNQGSNNAKQGVAAIIRDVASSLDISFIDTMLGTGNTPNPWVFGTGKSDTPTGNGNADYFVNPDGTHPTVAGYAYLAARIAHEITELQDA